jgi:cytochrome c-type protein NapB
MTPRLLNVLLAVAAGLAAVGFFVGTRPMPAPRMIDRGARAVVDDGTARPSRPYLALRQRTDDPRRAPESDLALLRAGIPGPLEPLPVLPPEARSVALELRAEGRAFAGAPPVIPHVIDEQGAAACLACHGEGLRVEGRIAPVVSHPRYANCTQCHTSVTPRAAGAPEMVLASSFSGLAEPGAGQRALPGAPPTIPHRLQMREDCQSCHGVTGLPGLRTSHPQRQSCTQCHAAATPAQPWR